MWLMLQHTEPDDYVVATNEAHSVREFLDAAGERLQLDWQQVVEIDARYFRPAEVDYLLGDSGKAQRVLGWKPKVTFQQLVHKMIDHDLQMARQEQTLREAGHLVLPRGGGQ
jgi:GDPmannose 4,6-dehydratase